MKKLMIVLAVPASIIVAAFVGVAQARKAKQYYGCTLVKLY
jgi:hypothetical protein